MHRNPGCGFNKGDQFMNRAKIRFIIIVSICLFFNPCSYVFAKEGGHEGGGERISEPVDEGVSRQVIEDNAIRNGYYRGEDIPYDDNSINGDNNQPSDNTGNQDPIDSTELNDPIDRSEGQDPIDNNDSETNDPIDKQDRDNHPINSAEKGDNEHDNDGED